MITTGKKRGRPRKDTTDGANGIFATENRGRRSARRLELAEIEAAIDRLIFKLMSMGGLTEIEDALRQARRLVYAAIHQG
jgi:hypothetical protein